jgi:hypothetical protein
MFRPWKSTGVTSIHIKYQRSMTFSQKRGGPRSEARCIISLHPSSCMAKEKLIWSSCCLITCKKVGSIAQGKTMGQGLVETHQALTGPEITRLNSKTGQKAPSALHQYKCRLEYAPSPQHVLAKALPQLAIPFSSQTRTAACLSTRARALITGSGELPRMGCVSSHVHPAT